MGCGFDMLILMNTSYHYQLFVLGHSVLLMRLLATEYSALIFGVDIFVVIVISYYYYRVA